MTRRRPRRVRLSVGAFCPDDPVVSRIRTTRTEVVWDVVSTWKPGRAHELRSPCLGRARHRYAERRVAGSIPGRITIVTEFRDPCAKKPRAWQKKIACGRNSARSCRVTRVSPRCATMEREASLVRKCGGRSGSPSHKRFASRRPSLLGRPGHAVLCCACVNGGLPEEAAGTWSAKRLSRREVRLRPRNGVRCRHFAACCGENVRQVGKSWPNVAQH